MIDFIEEKLSYVMGDVLAHKLCQRTQRAIAGLTNQLHEFIVFEARYFPTRGQVEKFYEEVGELEKRVNVLTSARK